MRADRDRLPSMLHAQLRSPEDVDDVDRAGRRNRLAERREGGAPEDRCLVRVHRHAVESRAQEVLEHALRRPCRVRRRAHDRDPAGLAEQPPDAGIVEELDRPAALVREDQIRHASPIVRRQVRASFAYGCPTAAGATLRPTNPARTTIVTMYGSAW